MNKIFQILKKNTISNLTFDFMGEHLMNARRAHVVPEIVVGNTQY